MFFKFSFLWQAQKHRRSASLKIQLVSLISDSAVEKKGCKIALAFNLNHNSYPENLLLWKTFARVRFYLVMWGIRGVRGHLKPTSIASFSISATAWYQEPKELKMRWQTNQLEMYATNANKTTDLSMLCHLRYVLTPDRWLPVEHLRYVLTTNL